MPRNVNVWITSESDGTTRDNVPDWLIHFDVRWTDNEGQPHQRVEDEYFLLLLNWLRQNHPQKAKRVMDELAFRIARAKYGVDEIEMVAAAESVAESSTPNMPHRMRRWLIRNSSILQWLQKRRA